MDEISALLRSAGPIAPDVVPMLALGAFAGLRESEIKRLDWAEIEELAECSWSEALSKSVVTSSELATLALLPRKFLHADWFGEVDQGFIIASRGGGKDLVALFMAKH